MRDHLGWHVACVLLLAVAAGSAGSLQELPPPYPRAGATNLLDNERVVVWDITWLRQAYPVHRHTRALVGVYYQSGDRVIVSTEGVRRPVSTKAWDTAFQLAGVTHSEEGASDTPLKAVFVELKEPGPTGVVDTASAPPAFPAGAGTKVRDNERATVWEFVPAPGPAATPHRHLRDAVVVVFRSGTPQASFVERGTIHSDEGTSGADRAYVFELK